MKKKTLTIKDNRNGKTYEFKVKDGSCGPAVADLSSFYEETGMFVYDPGFKSTASCKSKIAFIDGEKGIPFFNFFIIGYIYFFYIAAYTWNNRAHIGSNLSIICIFMR